MMIFRTTAFLGLIISSIILYLLFIVKCYLARKAK
jgi:hypothetical protein